MLLFVELSVDLKKGKSAKDGLYQYKNIAQNTNVGTIEVSWSLSTYHAILVNSYLAGSEKIHRFG
jgi:hypothetical protein